MPAQEKEQLYQTFDKSEKRGYFDDQVYQYLIETGIFQSFP